MTHAVKQKPKVLLLLLLLLLSVTRPHYSVEVDGDKISPSTFCRRSQRLKACPHWQQSCRKRRQIVAEAIVAENGIRDLHSPLLLVFFVSATF